MEFEFTSIQLACLIGAVVMIIFFLAILFSKDKVFYVYGELISIEKKVSSFSSFYSNDDYGIAQAICLSREKPTYDYKMTFLIAKEHYQTTLSEFQFHIFRNKGLEEGFKGMIVYSVHPLFGFTLKDLSS